MQKCKSETEKSEATGLKNMVNQRFFCPDVWSFNEAASTFFSLLNWTFRVTICTPLISLIIDFFTGFNYSTTEAELYIINWQFIFITKAASFLERVDGVSIPKWSTNYDLHSRILVKMVKNAQGFKNNETFLWFIINLLISGTFWVKLTDVEKLRMGCTKNLIFAAILLLIYPIKSWKIIDIETLGISWGVEEECIRSRLRFCWDYQWSTLVLHPNVLLHLQFKFVRQRRSLPKCSTSQWVKIT